MYYIIYDDYDVFEVVARFTDSRLAELYADVGNVMMGNRIRYSVETFQDIPLNPEIVGYVVFRKDKMFKHFHTAEEAEKYISRRAKPEDYSFFSPIQILEENEPHTSHPLK